MTETSNRQPTERFRALFEPRGIVVAGATAHPGKFGFVAYHNLRAAGYEGALYGTSLTGEDVLGEPTFPSIADVPDADLDLVFLAVPPAATETVLRQAADRGIRAAFCASAGYAEVSDEGRRHQDQLVAVADELGMLLAGPNGQGLISTPVAMCAQIVAPMPPPGPIGVASQSGGFVSSFGNLARRSGVGISRAVSAGNAAQIGVADYVEFFADDPATTVALTYLEDVAPDTVGRLGAAATTMPVVVVRGGRSDQGRRAVAAHTGSAAGTAEVDRELTEAGVTVVGSIHEGWDTAAAFATQPPPSGPRTVVFGTAGGWGVVTADAVVAEAGLELVDLPAELREEVDARVPPRWSRGNPIDLAGGETRDTIPELLPIIAGHPDVDAVIYLGLGIQSNQAALAAAGPYHPAHGLDRITDFHRRQDTRYAEAAAAAIDATGTPVLTATELAATDPENPGPATVRATGHHCFSAGPDAVRTLGHLRRRAARS